MKSVEQKRARRNRYVDAIKPFRDKYKCTAAEVFNVIQGIESRNTRLTADLSAERLKNKTLEERIMSLIPGKDVNEVLEHLQKISLV